MEPNQFSSDQNKNEVLTLTSGHPSSEDNSEGKFQAKLYPYNKCFGQPEEYLI